MKTISVVGAVIILDDSVLACRRAPFKSQAGLWEFPGGKVEAGESPEEALRREIIEELGVPVEVKQFVGTGEHQMKGSTHTLGLLSMCSSREGSG